MLEDALNRLAAAIEKQSELMAESHRIMTVITSKAPLPEPVQETALPPEQPKAERKARKAPTPEPMDLPEPEAAAEPETPSEPVTGTRPVNKKELMDLAMSMSRQDTAFGPKIRAILGKHGVTTIGALADEHVGAVFTELNNMANSHAREG